MGKAVTEGREKGSKEICEIIMMENFSTLIPKPRYSKLKEHQE